MPAWASHAVAEHVAVVARDDDVGRREQMAQARHVDLNGLAGARGRLVAPQSVDELLGGDDLPGVEHEHRQDCALLV
jgi:hypothetical protein